MIRHPERWLMVARFVRQREQASTLDIAHELGSNTQSAAHICNAMARHGLLVHVGTIPRRRQNGAQYGPHLIYATTTAGAAMQAPPPAQSRRDRHDVADLAPFGAGRCELAECLGLGRR